MSHFKKECCIWCSKTFKNVQYSTNTPTPTLSQWAKTWPSIIIREIYLINKIITKRSKCQCFLKEKKNSSKAELHRKERNRNHKPYFLRKHWRGRENSIWIKCIWELFHRPSMLHGTSVAVQRVYSYWRFFQPLCTERLWYECQAAWGISKYECCRACILCDSIFRYEKSTEIKIT